MKNTTKLTDERKAEKDMRGHKSILTEAEATVHGSGARNEDYGHPLDNFTQTAKLWEAYKGAGYKFTAEDVGIMMILVKVSRENFKPKRDNLLDIAGYAETVEWCKDEKIARDNKETLQQTFAQIPEILG